MICDFALIKMKYTLYVPNNHRGWLMISIWILGKIMISCFFRLLQTLVSKIVACAANFGIGPFIIPSGLMVVGSKSKSPLKIRRWECKLATKTRLTRSVRFRESSVSSSHSWIVVSGCFSIWSFHSLHDSSMMSILSGLPLNTVFNWRCRAGFLETLL